MLQLLIIIYIVWVRMTHLVIIHKFIGHHEKEKRWNYLVVGKSDDAVIELQMTILFLN